LAQAVLAQYNVADATFHKKKSQVAMMKVGALALLAILAVPHASALSGRRAALLQLQRQNASLPPAFAATGGAVLNLQGFCQRPDKTIACTAKPCCCWSTFGGEKHPTYPSKEAQSKQQCLNPPEGFVYSPEPGGAFSSGLMTTMKAQNLPVYKGRQLCCLRTKGGALEQSQRPLSQATPPLVAPPTTTTPGVPNPGQVDVAFTTKAPVVLAPLNAGEEYEVAQMEEAARAHMAAAIGLAKTAASLNASATEIAGANDMLINDPRLAAQRVRVAKMKVAIKGWSTRRWINLEKLKKASR